MSAQRLRDAAKVLRERAEKCDPWQGDDDHGSWADEYRTDEGNGTDAALIQIMHPGVALALADWLDVEADEQETLGGATGAGAMGHRVADLILGDQS